MNTLPLQDPVARQPFHHTSTKQQPHATLAIKLSLEGKSKTESENLTCSHVCLISIFTKLDDESSLNEQKCQFAEQNVIPAN